MKIQITILFFFFSLRNNAQEFVELINSDTSNFYTIQNKFNEYWDGKELVSGNGYKQFKRWEAFVEPRFYPTGMRPDPMIAWKEMERFNEYFGTDAPTKGSANWYQYMTHDSLTFTAFSAIPGHGRVTTIEVSPTDDNIIYVGAPSGGLWKSMDAGNSWIPMTDDLPIIGISDIAIDPLNPDIIYIATGDNHVNNTYSIGVLKSTNAGATWNLTGLNYDVLDAINIRKMVISPFSNNTLWVAANNGLFTTNNGGDTWNLVYSGSFRDVQCDPLNPNNIFATTNGGFYKSTDGGSSFVNVGLLENAAISRMEFDIVQTNSNIIYVISAAASNSSLYQIYKSVDGGNTFFSTANTTNVLGYSNSGGSGGQGWFDMDIAVDPMNENVVFTAGINIWKSVDGGDSFTVTSDWSNPYASNYVHGDVHTLEFVNGKLYSTCDGGVFYSINEGVSWTDISSNLTIGQIYAFKKSPFGDSLLLAGMQDVGTSYYDGTKWITVTWGDGFDSFFDPTNPQKMYTSAHFGQFFRTSTGINGFTNFSHGITEVSSFKSVLTQDPSSPTTFYAGFQNVWKSTNGTLSWTQISNFGNSFPLSRIIVSPNNPEIIFATTNYLVYRTLNGGSTWSIVTSGLPIGLVAISDLYVDPITDEVWLTYSGYSTNNKIYRSGDNGNSWNNETYNLPNLPVNCVVAEGTYLNGIYVGCDVGVFYKNDTMSNWSPFMDGLPNVIVTDLDILESKGLIRAATFGRGVWESELCTKDFVSISNTAQPGVTIKCFPNPSDGFIYFLVDANFNIENLVKFQVVNSNGQLLNVDDFVLEGNTIKLETKNLESGIYYALIYLNSEKHINKFVVSGS